MNVNAPEIRAVCGKSYVSRVRQCQALGLPTIEVRSPIECFGIPCHGVCSSP